MNENHYAIVIGINDYYPPEKRGLKTLSGAINDADAIYDWLTVQGNVPVANIKKFTSTIDPRNPVKSAIDLHIANLFREIAETKNADAERFYFYFAGHGLGVEDDATNIGLCMADFLQDVADITSLSSKDYKTKFLTDGLFNEIVIWLDCCRSDKFSYKPQPGPGIRRIGSKTDIKKFIGYATTPGNKAREVTVNSGEEIEARGIFTKVLLDGLNGGAAKDGKITAEGLVSHLYFHIPILAQKHGLSQKPDFDNNIHAANDIIFVS